MRSDRVVSQTTQIHIEIKHWSAYAHRHCGN